MPIKFRCSHCRQFLGISRAKAGDLTDCPTCGHTIRIPFLDGKIGPIPSPKLDLEDTELRSALSALATLEQQAIEEEPEPVVPTPVVTKSESDPKLAIVAEPIPEIVPENLEFDARDPQKELQSLAELAQKANRSPADRPPPTAMSVSPLLLLVACLVSFACGGFVGRALFPVSPKTSDPGPPPKQQVALERNPPKIDPIDDPPGIPISGTITYADREGESRPDRGARILILPADRVGVSELPEAGFLSGADGVDRRVLSAAAHELGGDFAVAGPTGEFSALVPKAGRYGLLVVSRGQIGDSQAMLPQQALDLIDAYFGSSEQILGAAQADYRFVVITNSNVQPLAVHFDDAQ